MKVKNKKLLFKITYIVGIGIPLVWYIYLRDAGYSKHEVYNEIAIPALATYLIIGMIATYDKYNK